MASSMQSGLLSKSIIDAGSSSSGPYHASDPHVQPDEAQYYLVPPFGMRPFMDLPPRESLSFSFLPLGIPITRKEIEIIKLTAQFAAVYGTFLRRDLMKKVSTNPQFEFLKSTDGRQHFYSRLACGYALVLKQSDLLKFRGSSTGPVIDGFFKLLSLVEKQVEGAEMAMTDLHAFEFIANMENKIVRVPPELWNIPSIPQPPMPQNDLQREQSRVRISGLLTQNEDGAQHIQPDEAQYYLVPPFGMRPFMDPPPPEILSFSFLPLGIPITRKEVEIIKLTAQFAAVYGTFLRRDLMKKVSTNPQFEFLKSTDDRHLFYTRLACGYALVLKQSDLLKFRGSSTGPVIDGFFKLLRLVEKQVEGAEMAMTDLHAFEFFANMESKIVRVPPELWNIPAKMQPVGMSPPPPSA